MIVTKRNVIGFATEAAEGSNVLTTSVPPGYPSYFWPGSKRQGRYYSNAKAAIDDTGKDAYIIQYVFNGKAAFFAAVICAIVFFLSFKK